jgi:hypothetical protein
MESRSRAFRIAAVIMVVAAVAGYRWWASDERAVRSQMSAIAESLTVRQDEGDLGAITRLAALRQLLAPEIHLSAGGPPLAAGPAGDVPPGEQVLGRDAVVGLVSRWAPPPGGVKVEFVDLQVTVDDDRAGAEVYGTARLTSQDASGGAIVDARELTVGFTQADGRWLVSSVRAEDTLTR